MTRRKPADTPLQLQSARCETGLMSAKMVDNDNDDLHWWWRHRSRLPELSKKPWITSNRWAPDQPNTIDTGSNHNEEGRHDDEHPRTKKSKESSSIDAEVIKGIQAQITFLTQRDELKKVGMTRPYLQEWDSVPYPSKFKPPTLYTYDCKSSPNQYIYYFRSQTGNVIDNDAIMTRLFIGTLKGVAFNWFWSLPSGSINSWIDLETWFLSRFYKDDTGVTMNKLFSTV